MSASNLRAIAKEITETTSKKLREGQLNRQVHVFSIDQDAIADELATEISLRDEKLGKSVPGYTATLDDLPPQELDKAASIFYNYLVSQSKLKPFLDSKTNVFTVAKGAGTYRLISDELTIASRKAIEHIEQVIGRNSYLNAGKLIQFDHTHASANVRTALALSRTREGGAVLGRLFDERLISKEDYEIYSDVLSYYKADTKVIEFSAEVIQGSLESGGTNEARGNTIELSRRGAILRALEKLALSKNIVGLKSSDSYEEFVIKKLNNAVVKAGASGTIKPLDIPTSKGSDKGRAKVAVRNAGLPKIARPRVKKSKSIRAGRYVSNLKDLINAKLGKTIVANMGPSSLVNRTGRLASSAKIETQTLTPEGFISLGYTYQRSPYDIFDPVLGKKPWNIPSRDPKKLIEKSIREIAQQYTRNRFYTRRV